MVYFALVSYLVTDKLIALKEFLNVPSQRLTAVNSIMAVLENEDRIGFYDADCGNGHKFIKLTKLLAWICANIFLHNFCFKINDKKAAQNMSKRRKLMTLH